MKETIKTIVNGAETTAGASLLVREYLQARILQALQLAGAFEQWAFLWLTCGHSWNGAGK